MTDQEILKLTGDKLSRVAGEMLQPDAKHISCCGICLVCGKELWEIRAGGPPLYRKAYHEPCTISIPLTWPEAMKWRDWAIKKFGIDEFAGEFARTFLDQVSLVKDDGIILRRIFKTSLTVLPEHYLKAVLLCVERSKK